jgi:hypothetical protein
MKKQFIFLLLIFSLVNTLFAAVETQFYQKVKITMKDGSEKVGFVTNYSDGKIDVDAFFDFYQNKKHGTKSFELYKNVYSIKDDGLAGSYALQMDEKQTIEAKNVVKMAPLPDPINNFTAADHFNYLSKGVIDLMQKESLFTDSMNDPHSDDASTLIAFNYDPKFNKKQIHEILLKYSKIQFDATRKGKIFDEEEVKQKMGWGKIVFFEVGGD